MRALAIVVAMAGLSGCAQPAGPALVSTQYPPGTGVVNSNSPFQTVNSLPPGAGNFSSNSALFAPDYAHINLRAF